MQTVTLHGHFVTSFTVLAGALVVVLLRWSFRSLGRMFSDLAALFRVVVNLALIALMLVIAFVGIAALAFISVRPQ
jgi:hypothetical protein